ncbi:MAG: hypothetical protein KGN34_02370 [Sphingomonadales bacterium]|nr:hypothetical protein [Sphingomonadales bacterium]
MAWLPGAPALALAAMALAWWFGSAPERLSAAAISALLVAETGLGHMSAAPWLYLGLHGLAFAALLVIAVTANRFYPMVMAAGELIALVSHALVVAHPPPGNAAYGLLIGMAKHVAVTALCIGLLAHARRTTLTGRYPDWRADQRRNS